MGTSEYTLGTRVSQFGRLTGASAKETLLPASKLGKGFMLLEVATSGYSNWQEYHDGKKTATATAYDVALSVAGTVAGTAAGTAIGMAIGGPLGAAIGGRIGGVAGSAAAKWASDTKVGKTVKNWVVNKLFG
jgi:hypothetical protein